MSEFNASLVSQIGVDLASLRYSDESVVIIGFGAHAPSHDCPRGHVSVTVHKGGEQATGEAVGLESALRIARYKVNAQIEAREKAREKERAKRDTDGSPQGGDREDGLHREATTAGAEGIAQNAPSHPPSGNPHDPR